jgi:hypothetical protein
VQVFVSHGSYSVQISLLPTVHADGDVLTRSTTHDQQQSAHAFGRPTDLNIVLSASLKMLEAHVPGDQWMYKQFSMKLL